MTPEAAQSLIYKILETHDIPLTKEDLAWVFTQDKTAAEVVEYAEQYLGNGCFLGLEEAEIYEHIKATHLLKLHKSRDLSLVYSLSDEELWVDVEGLRASTQEYQRQTEILRRQREVLEGIKKKEDSIRDSRVKLREKRKKKWVAERERLGVEIENLIVTLRHQLQDLITEDKQNGAHSAIAAGLVDLESMKSLLASDDKALEKLGRLAEDTNVEGLDGSQNDKDGDVVERVRKMTVKLAALMTAVVRNRLDRKYLETLAGEQISVEGMPDQEEYIAALKADLESLDAEIPAVAKMSAEAEFLKPMVGEVQKRKGMLEQVVSGRAGYIRDFLLHLQARNQQTIQLLEKDLYRRKALKELSDELEVLARSPLPQPHNPVGTGEGRPKTPPPGSNITSAFSRARTPVGRASTSPTKHLPVHLRRAAAQQSSAIPPSTPRRGTGRHTPRRRRRGRSGDDYSYDDDDDDDDDGPYDGEDPEIALLLHLGISLPAPLADVPQTPGTPFPRASESIYSPNTANKETKAHLNKQLHALRAKIAQQETQLDKSIKAAIQASISEAAGVAGIVGGQAWADREFGIISTPSYAARVGGTLAELLPEGLVNENVVKKIVEVEGEVDRLSKGVGRIVKGVEELKETDGAGAEYGGVQARERFVGRWGRGGV